MKLSKREVIMLTLLLIIALVFIEFKLILGPGIERLNQLNNREAELISKIDMINFDLTVAKTMEIKHKENLAEIDKLAEPFLAGVKPDVLLLFTHDMLQKHGFTPFNFNPSPLASQVLMPEEVTISQLTYRIKEIAREYRSLDGKNGDKPAVTPGAPAATGKKEAGDAVEQFSLQVNAMGTFLQIKALLDELASLKRTLLISQISMTPMDVTVGILEVQFTLDYYGIEKLKATVDPLNQWSRTTQPVSTADPYVALPTPIPAPTPTPGAQLTPQPTPKATP